MIPLALRLPALARDTDRRPRPSFVRDARDGLAFIWRTPYVLAVALGFWVVVLFSAPDDLILPFLATVTFKAGPVAVGVLLAAAWPPCWPAAAGRSGRPTAGGDQGHRGRVRRYGHR